MNFENIFFGNTQSDQRKFITAVLLHLRPRFSRIIVPCCGQFALVKCAIQAGYKREHIIASDVSLFSSILGYFYTNQPLSSLPLSFVSPDLQARYDTYPTDAHRAAFIFMLIKQCQLRPDILFENRYIDELSFSFDKNIDLIASTLIHHRETYAGITYRIEDLRLVTQYNDPETIILLNPPAFARGYTRMFNISKIINWNVSIEEWSMSKEYTSLYNTLKCLPSVSFTYRYREAAGFDTDIIYAPG